MGRSGEKWRVEDGVAGGIKFPVLCAMRDSLCCTCVTNFVFAASVWRAFRFCVVFWVSPGPVEKKADGLFNTDMGKKQIAWHGERLPSGKNK